MVVQGAPDLDKANTSYVERHNLTMRMSMRRFTRLTNGFSKKLEKHAAMQAIYFDSVPIPQRILSGPAPL